MIGYGEEFVKALKKWNDEIINWLKTKIKEAKEIPKVKGGVGLKTQLLEDNPIMILAGRD